MHNIDDKLKVFVMQLFHNYVNNQGIELAPQEPDELDHIFTSSDSDDITYLNCVGGSGLMEYMEDDSSLMVGIIPVKHIRTKCDGVLKEMLHDSASFVIYKSKEDENSYALWLIFSMENDRFHIEIRNEELLSKSQVDIPKFFDNVAKAVAEKETD